MRRLIQAGTARPAMALGRIRRHAWPYLVPSTALLLVLPVDHTTALRMLFLGLTAAVTIIYWRPRDTGIPPLLLPIGLCLAVALGSIPGAENPMFSLEEVKKEIGYGLVVYVAFYSLSRTFRDVSIWMFAMFVTLGWLATYALWQGMHRGTLGFDGWHGGILSYTVFVATVLPVLYMLLLHPDTSLRWKAGGVILLPLALFTTLLSENRISWVAIASSALFSCGLALASRLPARSKAIAVVAALLIVGVSTVALTNTAKIRIATPSPGTEQLAAAPLGTPTTAEALNLTAERDPRRLLWAYAADRIRQSPWMGTGFGRMGQAHAFAKHFNNTSEFVHAHNMFLDYGIQMGLPGIIAYLILFAAIVRQFWKLYRDPDPRVSLLGLAGIAVVVAVILKSATDDQFVRHNALLFWALVGMGLGYGARIKRNSGTGAPGGARD